MKRLGDLADMPAFWQFWTLPVNGAPSLRDSEAVDGAPWRSSLTLQDDALCRVLRGTMSKIRLVAAKVSFEHARHYFATFLRHPTNRSNEKQRRCCHTKWRRSRLTTPTRRHCEPSTL
jgi:hypothetical protein